MKITWLSLQMLFVPVFLAGTAVAKEDINYSIYSDNYPVEQIKGPVNQSTQKSEVLVPGKRDQLLMKAGLTQEVSSWDQLDRDRLVMRARHNPLLRFAGKYPNLPKDKLQKLHKLVQEKN
jgi:hypothetical protein